VIKAIVLTSFKRPGTESIFKPKTGTEKECITSDEVVITLYKVQRFNTSGLSTSKFRKLPNFKSFNFVR